MGHKRPTDIPATPPSFSSSSSSGNCLPEMESMSIPLLIEFLQSSFRKADFEKAESALISREASLKAEIERSFSGELTMKEVEKIELEARIEGLERDLGVLRSRCADLEQRIKKGEEGFGVERAELERKLREEKERYSLLEARFQDADGGKLGPCGEDEKHRRACASLEEISRLWEACRVAGEREQRAQETIATLLELQKEKGGLNSCWRKCRELEDENRGLRGTEIKIEEEKGKTKAWVLRHVEIATDPKKNPATMDKDNSLPGEVIEISDSEDETLTKDCEVKEHLVEKVVDVKKESVAGQSTKVMHSDKRRNLVLQEDDNSHMDGVLSVPTPKRKRISRVVTSDSENDDDVDDNIPISKLRLRQVEGVVEENKESSHVVEDMVPSRRRLVLLREVYRSDSSVKGKSPNPSTPSAKSRISRNKVTERRKLGYSDSDDDEEDKVNGRNEVDDIGSESEGESLGGFIVSSSDNPESEPSSENSSSKEEEGSDLDLDNVLANIRREKDTKVWEFEADMLASFSKDPELCMKAVCALYRQQTSDEQSVKETLLTNRRGFSKIDAQRGSTMAEFLTDGDPFGPLKKSVKDLENYDRKAIDYCHKLANRYSKQLFTIYQNKEDPFFHPSYDYATVPILAEVFKLLVSSFFLGKERLSSSPPRMTREWKTICLFPIPLSYILFTTMFSLLP
ncbi:Nucleotide-sugar transporter [Musa troglodytarum]|uniref:Nucleotide-sugar transporter n=1 Tax=Musa troglodytarum TaxID=320322 RepID=A0A9E7GW12_9LILI|nr:Nucleotide-sugar transporter [Musa troglodytarum]